ncbi:MAG: transposase, partial [Nitrosopumilaceae archaeon]|nr:transposase [Nitrosopumilaceae archaeon]
IRKRMARVANRRTYAECVAAKHVCGDYNPHTIVFEDMSLNGMTRKGKGRYKRGLNREMRFVRHYAIAQRIRNKAELMGITIRTVNPQYTSQECARCGHVAKESRVTRDMFRCVKCNYIQQADVNAAMIIGRRGLPPAPDM